MFLRVERFQAFVNLLEDSLERVRLIGEGLLHGQIGITNNLESILLSHLQNVSDFALNLIVEILVAGCSFLQS